MLITRGDGLVTTAQAARLAQRSPVTIRTWVRLGHLSPSGLDERGHLLYDPDEVAGVEKERRDNGLKASKGRLDPRRRRAA
jgi:DNA-binding transcriptional MerR regulator